MSVPELEARIPMQTSLEYRAEDAGRLVL